MSDAGSSGSFRDSRPNTSHLFIDPIGAEIIDLNLIPISPRKDYPPIVLKREKSYENLKKLSGFITSDMIRNKQIEQEQEFQRYNNNNNIYSPLSPRRSGLIHDRELPQNPNKGDSSALMERFKSKLMNTESVRNQTLMKFKPLDQSEDLQAHRNTKLTKIYSDTETSNFDPENGKRLYNDDRFRKFRVNTTSHHSPLVERSPIRTHRSNSLRTLSQGKFANGMNMQVKRFSQENSDVDEYEIGSESENHKIFFHNDDIPGNNGMEDEYIPNFDFSYVLEKWESTGKLETISTVNSVVSPLTPIMTSHAKVSPVAVPTHNVSSSNVEIDNSFHEALNDPSIPEHERIVMQSLPAEFRDLPFTVRRSLIKDLSATVNEAVIHEVVKKRFKKKSLSMANSFLASFSDRRSVLKETDPGYIIMNHKLGKLLGHGAWGLVRECTGPNGEERAMKIIKADSEDVKRFFKRETDIWAQMDHDHILHLISVAFGNKAIFCLCDKVKNGTLFDIASRWGLFDKPQTAVSQDDRLIISRNYMLQLAHALNYMHKKGFVHGDVKLENCLIQGSKLLLSDFGMSMRYTSFNSIPTRRPSMVRSASENYSEADGSAIQRITADTSLVHDDTRLNLNQIPCKRECSEFDPRPFEPPNENDPITQRLNKVPTDENLPHSHIGSLPYAAPELLETNPVPLGPSADIWAFGVTLYTLIVGRLPFHYSYEPKIKAMISAVMYDVDSLKIACSLKNGNKSRLYDVVVGCLTKDLNKRLNMEQILSLLKAS